MTKNVVRKEDAFICKYGRQVYLNRSVLAFALNAHAWLFERGWTNASVLEIDSQVLYVVEMATQQVVAILTFFRADEEPVYWVQLVFVDKRVRRFGLFKMMWERLLTISKLDGMQAIEVSHHVQNEAIESALNKLKCEENYIVHRYEVVSLVETKKGDKKK